MKEFKKEFRKIIYSTVTRKYRNNISDIRRYDRKRNVGSFNLKINPDINSDDYVEEFGTRWGLGSGNGIGCRVYPNTKEVQVWANIGVRYSDTLMFKYKETINELISKKEEIKKMIEDVKSEYLYHQDFFN